ncbi:hypothetical protein BJ546DRAFT_210965 [Cryomyces antarcticus]
MVGTKGISLSGGQRNRIALARAVYSRKPILIIDDILSGPDQSTEKKVFHGVFGQNGILKRSNMTVVLATHSIHWASDADKIDSRHLVEMMGRVNSVDDDVQVGILFIPRTSLALHAKQLSALMSAHFSFIASTDVESITNRFSQDISLVDGTLPSTFINTTLGELRYFQNRLPTLT